LNDVRVRRARLEDERDRQTEDKKDSTHLGPAAGGNRSVPDGESNAKGRPLAAFELAAPW
jgi:hypothetical protein